MQNQNIRFATVLATLCATLLLQGCGQEIDARQASNINGLLYKLNDSEPFTGTITNFPTSMELLGFATTGSCTLPVSKGRPDGTYKCISTDGVKIAEVNFKEGVRDGSEQIWDKGTGKLIASAHWNQGKKDGKEEHYNSTNEKLILQINWDHGNKVDEEKHWSSSGEVLLTDLHWKDGKATGFIKTVETLTGTEGIVEEANYKDGVLDGPKKSFSVDEAHSSGVGTKGGMVKFYLSSQENYANGKQEGLQQTFGANGDVFSETRYSNNVKMELTQYGMVGGKRTQILHKVNINPAATDPSEIQRSFVKDGKEICLENDGTVTCDIDWVKGRPLKGSMRQKIAGERQALIATFNGVPDATGNGLVKDGVEKRVVESSGQPDSDITWNKGVAVSITTYTAEGGKVQATQTPIPTPKQDDPEGVFPTQAW